MKAFMTGATGFIGSHFVNEANKRGLELTCLKRENSITRVRINKEPRWILDSNNNDLIESLVGNEILFHFASTGVSPQKSNWYDLIQFNIVESFNIINQGYKAGIRKMVIIGTVDEFGFDLNFEKIRHDQKLQPRTPYSSSKAAFFLLMTIELFLSLLISILGKSES